MGADYTAIAVIGCEINPKQLFVERRVPHRKHAMPPGARFCPTCGAPAETTEVVDVIEEGEVDIAKPFTVWCGTDRKCVVVGIGTSTGWNEINSLKRVDLAKVEDELKEVLSPLGWWDESKFGLHAILYCSY